MVMLTAAAGFLLAPTTAGWATFFHAVLGTVLLAAGTSVLNQYVELDADARMRRTLHRSLPRGLVAPAAALRFGMLLSGAGALYLAVATSLTTALLGWLSAAVYLLLYTPLKRKTPWATFIGAVPGALPPLMGWTAAGHSLAEFPGWLLFLLLFAWQVPHFLAIALLYDDDYRRGGFRMLPRRNGVDWAAPKVLLFSAFLLFLLLTPALVLNRSLLGIPPALALGIWFLSAALKLATRPSRATARLVLRRSVLFLPLALACFLVG
ncbi:MAG: heme o synthase [Acidobacteriota bacterium]